MDYNRRHNHLERQDQSTGKCHDQPQGPERERGREGGSEGGREGEREGGREGERESSLILIIIN